MKSLKLSLSFLLISSAVLAEDQVKDPKAAAQPRSSADILNLTWKASHENNLQHIYDLVKEMLLNYETKAIDQANGLKDFPSREKVENYKVMNDVATALFVKAEALRDQGQNEEAIKVFKDIIQRFPFSQNFDPSRGGFWSVKEKAQLIVNMLEGITEPEKVEVKKGPATKPRLALPGKLKLVDYRKFGTFHHVGTKNYHYEIFDRKGLIEAVGEGIYPNISDVFKDPGYKKAAKEGRLKGSHWDFVNTPDLEAAIYKWATSSEPWGVRLFYMGIIFEKAKMYFQAIKCYHALIVHFPEIQAWTYWHTPWYPGQAAIAKIQHIIRMHPELNLQFKGSRIQTLNSYDNDPANDITITKPGILRRVSTQYRKKEELTQENGKASILGEPIRKLGEGKVHFVQYANKHWQLMVDGKPFIIKGITYGPTKVGESPDKGTLSNWMDNDFNKNGLIDGPYDAWMDLNKNNIQDANEKSEGDFSLMKKMGVNTLRMFEHPDRPIRKDLLNKMHEEFGFKVILGNLIGKYAVGSGASWSEGTDYENPKHLEEMKKSVRLMVEQFKDEPFVLMWLLGNENNYGVASNADKKPEAYYKFVNEVALMIKAMDPNHPVAICNGDILYLDLFNKLAPDIDAYGGNVYRGDYGFGSYWQQLAEVTGKPAFITEYGAPAYSGADLTAEEAEIAQAAYHKGNWMDIYSNTAGFAEGEGNSIGGVTFEWLDEWWKNYEPSKHDIKADVVGPFPGGYYFEEWFGLLGQGNGQNSPYLREPRKVYNTYKELW